MKVVINKCHGGFNLSDAAFERYLDLKEITWHKSKEQRFGSYHYYTIPEEEWNRLYDYKQEKSNMFLNHDKIERDDPILVQVVESLGDLASGEFSKLKVVEIPDDVNWKISDYDGIESIHEVHRVWS